MKKNNSLVIRQKDFLETEEGLFFAVVADDIEEGRSLAFLRYKSYISPEGVHIRKKLATEQAISLLEHHYPEYLYHSIVFDADLHGVPINRIEKHHQAKVKLQTLLSNQSTTLQNKLVCLITLLSENGIPLNTLGVTGSILIGAEGKDSDIDLIIYDRVIFHKARKLIEKLIDKNKLSALDEYFWKDSFDRRACSLCFEDYVWHEKRKFNKAIFAGVKFDISLVLTKAVDDDNTYIKKGLMKLTAEVINDQYSFDSPSIYFIDNSEFQKVICFTPTYTGQAITGELIEVSGFVEESADGVNRRLIVGSTREAVGEYIKVVR